ncbi:MAG: tyrosine protein phosphatase [Candidatus Atribacteria bacterium]|nr:tyrosine protein phosphatase [Candidatus Atribacteria bacterium]
MIDTHCHILPHLDDGPDSWDESLLMAKMAAEDGITAIIATPHYKNGIYETKKSQILEKVAQLNELLVNQEIPIKIFPGSEIHFYDGLLKDLTGDSLVTLNSSSYLLLEFPNSIRISTEIENVIFQIQLKGYLPIIAHVERCFYFYHHIDLLEEWHQRGIETQLTSASLSGLFGQEIKNFAIKVLKRGIIDYLVTDAHSVSKYGRKPILSEGVQKASQVIGQQEALNLVTTNPKKIIKNNDKE